MKQTTQSFLAPLAIFLALGSLTFAAPLNWHPNTHGEFSRIEHVIPI